MDEGVTTFSLVLMIVCLLCSATEIGKIKTRGDLFQTHDLCGAVPEEANRGLPVVLFVVQRFQIL